MIFGFLVHSFKPAAAAGAPAGSARYHPIRLLHVDPMDREHHGERASAGVLTCREATISDVPSPPPQTPNAASPRGYAR